MNSLVHTVTLEYIDADETRNTHNPASTIVPYIYGLDGVAQSQNVFFKNVLWWSLGILVMVVLFIRLLEMVWAVLRQTNAVSAPGDKQRYWATSQWSWMPFLKKHVIYAPLWNKRHSREFRLSGALSFGTLPSRIQGVIMALYLASNLVYIFILDWSDENRYKVCADLRGRAGSLALANVVPLVLLAGRNNPLIAILQISFDTYNLLHRWLGRIVILEVLVHGIAWLIPTIAAGRWSAAIHNTSVRAGASGMMAMVVLGVASLSPIRHTFYETFVNTHILLALIALSCAWVHCASALPPGSIPELTWVIAAMGLWLGDRLIRATRLLYVNWSDQGFTDAFCEALPCEATRVTLRLPRRVVIRPGTHAYIRIKGVRPWENHPFSIAWVTHHENDPLSFTEKDGIRPQKGRRRTTEVSFIIAARTGFTRKLYDVTKRPSLGVIYTRAALEGPYGGHHSLDSYGHVVLFAGSTGITHQISYIRPLLEGYNASTVATCRISLIWIIRQFDALEWIRPYMDAVLRMPKRKEVLRVLVFITRPRSHGDLASESETVKLYPGRPNLPFILGMEVQEQVGAMCVSVCGPGSLADDVRAAVRRVQGDTVVDFVEESFTW